MYFSGYLQSSRKEKEKEKEAKGKAKDKTQDKEHEKSIKKVTFSNFSVFISFVSNVFLLSRRTKRICLCSDITLEKL